MTSFKKRFLQILIPEEKLHIIHEGALELHEDTEQMPLYLFKSGLIYVTHIKQERKIVINA